MNYEVQENRGFTAVDAPLPSISREPCYIRAIWRGSYADAWQLPSYPTL
jgi:hypothetical protein